MANVATITPLNQFFDTNGSPLNSGYLYFGLPNQDPEQFPVQMYWDAAGTVPALQPIRTISGYPSRAGSPAIIYGPDSYALRVRNSASVQVLYAPELGGLSSSASLAASGGSDLVGFIQAGVGAIARTAQSKMRDIVCVFDFMTTAQIADVKAKTALIDVTAAMQAAHNTGQVVYYPAGTYSFSTITMSDGGIVGDGKGKSVLRTSDVSSANIVTYTGTGGDAQIPLFRDFRIDNATLKPAGAALIFNPSTGQLNYPVVDNIFIFNLPRGIQFNAAALFKVTNCDIVNYTDAGIYVSNTNNVDSGDSLIQGCFINTGQASGARNGIYQTSSGGLKVVNNKILGGDNGFVEAYSANTASGPLLIVGNSIENTLSNGIFIGRAATFTGGYGGVVIVGNEIGVCLGAGIATDTIGGLIDFTISSNYIQLSNSTANAITLNGVNKFVISANNIVGGATGVFITSTCARGQIGPNLYASQATTSVNNLSTTTFITGAKQTGTVASISHTSAYGSLFIGSSAVTFPTPFTVIPTVTCNAGGGLGVASGFCGFATNVTTTGFTYNLVAIASGSTATNMWAAEGII